MRLVFLFGLFLLIIGVYPVKAQSDCGDERPICKGVSASIDKNISGDLQEVYVTDKQIAQEKQNLLFMINLAMHGVSSNNAEQDMRKNKNFCDWINFSVAKGLFPPSGYDAITCMKNTLQLDFGHSSKKDFSAWDDASVGYNLKLKADEYQKKIKFIEKDFTDILKLQFVKRKKYESVFKGKSAFYYEYNYYWKLNPAIKVSISVLGTAINNEKYPEHARLIIITREGDMKEIPPK